MTASPLAPQPGSKVLPETLAAALPNHEKEEEKEKEKEKAKESSQWIRENFEAITIAIIMALVLRHFCIEAFKIPTPSMEPTLIGREYNGDRILVNKYAYLLKDPDRWDIIVFKYPLNITKNYIKRLVGRPGETLEIRDGDIFINGRIERKPGRIQQTLWKNWAFFEWLDGGERFLNEWNLLEPETATWEFRDRTIHASSQGTSFVELDRQITDTYRHYNQHDIRPVGDVRLALTAEPGSKTQEVLLSLRAHSTTVALHVAVEGSDAETRLMRGTEEIWRDPDLKIPADQKTEIVLYDVDDTLTVEIAGQSTFNHEYLGPYQTEERPSTFEHGSFHVRFGFRGGDVRIQDVSVHRDIYYTWKARETWNQSPGGGEFPSWKIPADHFFALGDNSPQSKDCRYWGATTRTLTDGTVIYGDATPRVEDAAENNSDPNAFIDCFGEPHTLDDIQFKTYSSADQPTTHAFIHRRYLMGKAFFVFWPPYRRRIDLQAYINTGVVGDQRLQLNTRFVR